MILFYYISEFMQDFFYILYRQIYIFPKNMQHRQAERHTIQHNQNTIYGGNIYE